MQIGSQRSKHRGQRHAMLGTASSTDVKVIVGCMPGLNKDFT